MPRIFGLRGLLFVKLLSSPMPHARVRNLDISAALAMPGVEAILTADDLPKVEAPNEAGLTNEPLYEGEPIVAVAAVDELTAADAIERIRLDLEPLPFVLDPLESLRPGGPNARLDGNASVGRGREPTTIKWTEADFAELAEGRLPMGEPTAEWSVGDIDAGFAEADLILDETIFHQSLSHQPLESRSCLAYWQNGKVYVHPSVQSTARSVGPGGQVGRRLAVGCGPRRRVLWRRIWEQGQRLRGHPLPHLARQEDRQAGHDAGDAPGRALLRPGPARRPGARENWVPPGWSDHGDGSVHHWGPAGRTVARATTCRWVQLPHSRTNL